MCFQLVDCWLQASGLLWSICLCPVAGEALESICAGPTCHFCRDSSRNVTCMCAACRPAVAMTCRTEDMIQQPVSP
ncbi:hypothetical protein BDV97DRAFT_344336 [Delphinella strobiligena]|nr:hypothetical protein BDV97DRAFT_344336 [Delphinella strobiligena]